MRWLHEARIHAYREEIGYALKRYGRTQDQSEIDLICSLWPIYLNALEAKQETQGKNEHEPSNEKSPNRD